MSPLSLVCAAVLHAVAIENVTVEVGDGQHRTQVTVILDGGRITAIGPTVAVPAGATRIDGTGKVLTPGFIDVLSSLGLQEVSAEPATVDRGLKEPFAPAFRAVDGFNPRSVWIPVARQEGVTSAVLAPSGGVLAGLGHWVPYSGQLSSGAEAPRPVALFGEVGADAAAKVGGARGGVWLKLKEIFADARAYARNRALFERNQHRPLSLAPLHLEAVLEVVERRIPLAVEAHRASDILRALTFARDENVSIIILGGTEAHLVAAELAKARVPVVLVPTQQVPGSFERLAARDDAAGVLDRAGVTVVINVSDSSRRRLRQEAGVAVAFGMDRARALAAITSAPARAFRLDPKLGTVEVGNRADVVLWSGDPLELSSHATHVFIAGQPQDLTTRQTRLIQRYLGK